ncbi:hypothetical protein MKX01_028797 [Papaver californicum]|nr:hypothetical protein MKX01_028797 [Papaver californicum]
MARGCTTGNSYEETRKKQIEDNKKRFQDLGIAKMTKCLSEVANMEKQSPAKKQAKPKIRKTPTSPGEVRRSSRARNTISYKEVFVDDHLLGRRFRSSSSFSTSELERKSEHPSSVKSMVRSHVYSCFWLWMKDIEYDAIYLPKRTGLSGGWKAFALDLKLDDGIQVSYNWGDDDAEEIKKSSTEDTADENISEAKVVESKAGGRSTRNSKIVKKSDTDNEDAGDSMSEEKGVVNSESRRSRTHNSKRLKKTDTDNGDSDDSMSEEKRVVESKARGRTRNTKGVKKSDTHDADVDENMSEEKDVVVDRTRNSQRVMTSAHDACITCSS